MTAAEDDAVGSPLKRAQDKDRVQAARTGNADDFDVGGIFEAIAAGQIRSRVRTPVAAKGYDLRFKCTFFFGNIVSGSRIYTLVRRVVFYSGV